MKPRQHRYFGEDAVNVRLADRMGTGQDVLADLQRTIAGPAISIRQGGRKTMQDQTPVVEANAVNDGKPIDVEAFRA